MSSDASALVTMVFSRGVRPEQDVKKTPTAFSDTRRFNHFGDRSAGRRKTASVRSPAYELGRSPVCQSAAGQALRHFGVSSQRVCGGSTASMGHTTTWSAVCCGPDEWRGDFREEPVDIGSCHTPRRREVSKFGGGSRATSNFFRAFSWYPGTPCHPDRHNKFHSIFVFNVPMPFFCVLKAFRHVRPNFWPYIFGHGCVPELLSISSRTTCIHVEVFRSKLRTGKNGSTALAAPGHHQRSNSHSFDFPAIHPVSYLSA